MGAYWAVWPIIIVQIFAFSLMFVRSTAHPLGMQMRYWIVGVLMIANIMIVLSFTHDAALLRHLYF